MKRIKRTIHRWLGRLFLAQVRWMHRKRLLPVSRGFGFRRGTPVGRHYIDGFLRRYRDEVRGVCLEFGEARYKLFFPGATHYEVFSVRPDPDVTRVGDVHAPPEDFLGLFDWIICTQVFEHLAHPPQAAASLHRMLKPGGRLLLTVPFINIVHGDPGDYFRYTRDGIGTVLRDAGFELVTVESGGAFLPSVGALLGYVVEDFTPEELAQGGDEYPYISLVHARRTET